MGPSTGARSKQKGQLDPHRIPPIAGAFTQMVDNTLPPMRPTGSCSSNLIQIRPVRVDKRAQELDQGANKAKNLKLSPPVKGDRSKLLVVTDARYSKLLQHIRKSDTSPWEIKIEERRVLKLEHWEEIIEDLSTKPQNKPTKAIVILATSDDFTSNEIKYQHGNKYNQIIAKDNLNQEVLLNKIRIVQTNLIKKYPDMLIIITSPLPIDLLKYNTKARQRAAVPIINQTKYSNEQKIHQITLNKALAEWRVKLTKTDYVFNLDLTREMVSDDRKTFKPSDDFNTGKRLHRPDLLDDGWHLSSKGCQVVWKLIEPIISRVANENKIAKWKAALQRSENQN